MPYHSSFFPKSGSPDTPCMKCMMYGHGKRACREAGRARWDLLSAFTREQAEAAHVLTEWEGYHPEQTTDAEMQDTGEDSPRTATIEDFEDLLERRIDAFKEGHDTSMARLVTIVLELKGTVDKLSAQNGELLVRLKGLEARSPRTTTVSHGATQTSPPPWVANSATQTPPAPPPPPTTTVVETPAAPPAATKSKRKLSGPPSPAQKPTKNAREISPPPSLMHSKHAGPSDALVSVRPTPDTRDAPAPSAPRDEAEAKEGWKKVERKKRRRPSGRTAAQSAGKSVPSWAQVAGDGAVCFNFYIGGGAGIAKPHTVRKPWGGSKKKEKKKEKGKGKEQRAPRV